MMKAGTVKAKDINLLKYNYMIELFKNEDNRQEVAIEICKMLSDGLLKVASTSTSNELLFILSSKYRSKCCRCNTYYAYGDPIFCQNKKAWHVRCAEDNELENKFYKNCLEKGLIEEDEKKKV